MLLVAHFYVFKEVEPARREPGSVDKAQGKERGPVHPEVVNYHVVQFPRKTRTTRLDIDDRYRRHDITLMYDQLAHFESYDGLKNG